MKQRVLSEIAILAVCVIGSLIYLSLQLVTQPLGLRAVEPWIIAALCCLLGTMLVREKIRRRRETKALKRLRSLSETERANALKLAEQNEWLRMTEALAHVGHWRMTFADNQLFWSDETYVIHGWSHDRELILEEAIEVYHPDDRDAVVEAIEKARTSGKPYSFQARLIRPDGTSRHVEAVAKVETDDDGTPIAMFGVLADRTDEREMHAALVEASDTALAAAAAKSTFLATMSHEIRTPMNGVLGFADLLCRSNLPEREKQFAEMIGESARSMTLLLNDILDLSKIEAGELVPRNEPTDIEHLTRHVTRLVTPLAKEKGLEVKLSIAPGVPKQCRTDPLRLRQILSNLMGNAAKFTEHGFIAMRVMWEDGRLQVEVRDTGIGIAKAEAELVFDAFAQASGGGFTARGGTGLGLAISRQLAELLGGSISLSSQPGEGSVFTLEIAAPQVIEAVKAKPVAQASSPAVNDGSARHRVLLAEDFDVNQMLVQAMAEHADIDLSIADNGQIALVMIEEAEAQEEPFALVLMDLQMPVMDGYDATIRLRQKGYDPERLPIVAMTANAFPEDIENCKAVGMQDHLAKPLTFEQFQQTLERWLLSQERRAA